MNILTSRNADFEKLAKRTGSMAGSMRTLVQPVKPASVEDSRKLNSQSKPRDVKLRVEVVVEGLAY